MSGQGSAPTVERAIEETIKRRIVRLEELVAKCDRNIREAFRKDVRLQLMETNTKLAAQAGIVALREVLEELRTGSVGA